VGAAASDDSLFRGIRFVRPDLGVKEQENKRWAASQENGRGELQIHVSNTQI
jgi:hypothetical protein